MSDDSQRRRFRYFGGAHALTPVAQLIMAEDIDALDNELGKSWRLNEPFELLENGRGGTALAIQLALVERRYKVIDYLLARKADLNAPRAAAIVSAVNAIDTALIDKLIAAGADVRGVNSVGYDAMAQSIAWGYFELIPHLEAHGLRFDNGSGAALRTAIRSKDRDLVEYMLKRGADPNIPQPLAQGGLGERPLHAATYTRDLEMVKLLIMHGADPGLPNVVGQRPYLYAWGVLGLEDMAQWLRAREPAAAHDVDAMRKLALAFGAPPELISRLTDGPHALGATPDGEPAVRLLPIGDIHQFTGMGRKLLALSSQVYDGAPVSDIVWSGWRKRVLGIDIEHGEKFKLGSWSDFSARPYELLDHICD